MTAHRSFKELILKAISKVKVKYKLDSEFPL